MSVLLNKKIEDLSKKIGQLKAQKSAQDARERTRAAEEKKKADTRRKILLGAFMLDRIGASAASSLKVQGASFSDWLTRTQDRELFGLGPHSSPIREESTPVLDDGAQA